jgi:hypothetical protein
MRYGPKGRHLGVPSKSQRWCDQLSCHHTSRRRHTFKLGECPLPEGYTSVGKDGPAVHRLFRLVAWLSEDVRPALHARIEPDSQ